MSGDVSQGLLGNPVNNEAQVINVHYDLMASGLITGVSVASDPVMDERLPGTSVLWISCLLVSSPSPNLHNGERHVVAGKGTSRYVSNFKQMLNLLNIAGQQNKLIINYFIML